MEIQYTVQQPYVEKTIASSSNVATPVSAGVSTVVRAPGVSVDVVKSGGLVSVNTGELMISWSWSLIRVQRVKKWRSELFVAQKLINYKISLAWICNST